MIVLDCDLCVVVSDDRANDFYVSFQNHVKMPSHESCFDLEMSYSRSRRLSLELYRHLRELPR